MYLFQKHDFIRFTHTHTAETVKHSPIPLMDTLNHSLFQHNHPLQGRLGAGLLARLPDSNANVLIGVKTELETTLSGQLTARFIDTYFFVDWITQNILGKFGHSCGPVLSLCWARFDDDERGCFRRWNKSMLDPIHRYRNRYFESLMIKYHEVCEYLVQCFALDHPMSGC